MAECQGQPHGTGKTGNGTGVPKCAKGGPGHTDAHSLHVTRRESEHSPDSAAPRLLTFQGCLAAAPEIGSFPARYAHRWRASSGLQRVPQAACCFSLPQIAHSVPSRPWPHPRAAGPPPPAALPAVMQGATTITPPTIASPISALTLLDPRRRRHHHHLVLRRGIESTTIEPGAVEEEIRTAEAEIGPATRTSTITITAAAAAATTTVGEAQTPTLFPGRQPAILHEEEGEEEEEEEGGH